MTQTSKNPIFHEFPINSPIQTLSGPIDIQACSLVVRMEPPSTVIQISCGRHHSVFLTLGGQIFSCGENECGQLGLGHTDDVMIPKMITDQLGKERIGYIACGADHTLALTARGILVVCSSTTLDN